MLRCLTEMAQIEKPAAEHPHRLFSSVVISALNYKIVGVKQPVFLCLTGGDGQGFPTATVLEYPESIMCGRYTLTVSRKTVAEQIGWSRHLNALDRGKSRPST